jgi:hypothetical protein
MSQQGRFPLPDEITALVVLRPSGQIAEAVPGSHVPASPTVRSASHDSRIERGGPRAARWNGVQAP